MNNPCHIELVVEQREEAVPKPEGKGVKKGRANSRLRSGATA